MSESVNNSEEICKVLRGWEGSYNVHMGMVKTAVWLPKVLQGSASILADLALMTVQA